MMYNPDLQYRCTIIRGKTQRELDNLLPTYAHIIADICPCSKSMFEQVFNDLLSDVIYKKEFVQLNKANQKTIRNHITEVAGKLFGLYVNDGQYVHESETNKKLLLYSDQPAFFKNLCLNFQFPNGTQKINTVVERIQDGIKFKPFHFILELLVNAEKQHVTLTKRELAYYVLNAKQVLRGEITTLEVLTSILHDRNNGILKKTGSGSYHTQHITEQLNLLLLANLIEFKDGFVFINE